MSDQLIVERAGLEKKDKSELQAIVEALGGKASSRLRKSELIDKVLELSGALDQPATPAPPIGGGSSEPSSSAPGKGDSASPIASPQPASTAQPPTRTETQTPSDAASPSSGSQPKPDPVNPQNGSERDPNRGGRGSNQPNRSGQSNRSNRARNSGQANQHPVGPDGEPLADWEIEIARNQQDQPNQSGRQGQKGGSPQAKNGSASDNSGPKADDDTDPNNRRNRRRGRNRGRDRDDMAQETVIAEPSPVEGYLDLRDEGYGFLRVDGYLPSKEDVYVSVKQVRQYGLRKGDHLTGLSRPATRTEKNPGFHQIDTVNGDKPESGRNRPRFEELTPVFPFEPIGLELEDEPENLALRVIDLVSPIGKGQRGAILTPPRAGQSGLVKELSRAVEVNHPDIELFVLLLGERPEEVTDIRHSFARAEVVASTFDRPAEEHTAITELTLERAKRLVEQGKDVCIVAEGLTRLARAYNLAGSHSNRSTGAGIDGAAVSLAKRFFGAARKMAEGGSLTILATVAVDTGAPIDELIRDEFEGTANMELRLDADLAAHQVVPPINIDGSATLRVERIRYGQQAVADNDSIDHKVRSRLGSYDPSSVSGKVQAHQSFVSSLKLSATNREFLDEITARPSN